MFKGHVTHPFTRPTGDIQDSMDGSEVKVVREQTTHTSRHQTIKFHQPCCFCPTFGAQHVLVFITRRIDWHEVATSRWCCLFTCCCDSSIATLESCNSWLARRNEGLDQYLTVVPESAGFGKTTLVSHWLASLGERQDPPPVAWVSLDEGDNDPVRFWSYVITACQAFHADIGE